MVLIDNPHHMGLIRAKTKEVKWCTQRGHTWPFLHILYFFCIFVIYYILYIFLNNLKIVKAWRCPRQDQERHLVAAINQMSFRPLIHHLLNFHLDWKFEQWYCRGLKTHLDCSFYIFSKTYILPGNQLCIFFKLYSGKLCLICRHDDSMVFVWAPEARSLKWRLWFTRRCSYLSWSRIS